MLQLSKKEQKIPISSSFAPKTASWAFAHLKPTNLCLGPKWGRGAKPEFFKILFEFHGYILPLLALILNIK